MAAQQFHPNDLDRHSLGTKNQNLTDLLADADPTIPVPTYPGWTMSRPLRHVGRGDRWAARIIADPG